MDDGSKSRDSVYLNTQKFSLREQKFLQRKLKEDLEIKSTLNRDKTYYRLRISQKSVKRFKDLVVPYILPTFSYKIP